MRFAETKLFSAWIALALLVFSLTAKSSDEHVGHMGMQHGPQEIPENLPVPTLALRLDKDVMTGYNLKIVTSNYEFRSPVDAGPEPYAVLEGHAHLFINGIKIGRLYGPDVHLPGKLFRQGANQILVTLNSHGHGDWSRDGAQVVAKLGIDTEQQPMVRYRLSSATAE